MDENIMPCIILPDGSVVQANTDESPMLVDSCGAGLYHEWELVNNWRHWHDRTQNQTTRMRAEFWDSSREFWLLEDSVQTLLEAGDAWSKIAGKGTLQELGAWVLDVVYTHGMVQGLSLIHI